MNMAELEGRTALVTGAASGIGAAVARRLRKAGARVAALDLHAVEGVDASALADLRSAAEAASALRSLSQAVGGFDIAVHCAAVCPPGSVMESDESQFVDTYAVNVLGALRVIRHCVPSMRQRGGGSIVLLSSINARFATPTLAAYASSKAALEELARSAALELAESNVRVNAIAPASIDTPMLRASFEREPDADAARARNIERHPLGRLGTAEDVAELALFLASPRSSWITGGVFPIDGGAGVTRR